MVYGERRHAEPPGGNDHPQLYRYLKGVNLRNASLQKIGLPGQVSGDQINYTCFKAEE